MAQWWLAFLIGEREKRQEEARRRKADEEAGTDLVGLMRSLGLTCDALARLNGPRRH